MEKKQVLLIGFGPLAEKLKEMIAPLGICVRTYGASYLSKTVGELCMEENTPAPEPAMERGLVLFHHFRQEELDPVLKILREAKLSKQPLKAMVTATNRHWKAENLIGELQQEQELMGELMKLKKLRDSMPMPAFTDVPAMKARMAAEVQLSGGEGVTAETIRCAYRELSKFAE